MAGAHVIMFDATARRLASVLTSGAGTFELPVPGSGHYVIRAEMIGRRSVESSVSVSVTDSVVQVVLEMQDEPILLAGIEVRGLARCQPGIGPDVQLAWEEARKALTLEVAMRERQDYLFDLLRFERFMDPSGRRVRQQKEHRFTQTAPESFRSAPAQELARSGFLRSAADTAYVYGPTAEVLVSDAFMETHCFWLRTSANQRQIGLAFRPLPNRTVTDIEGVLWLDEASAVLRSVEFSYVNLPQTARGVGYGGRAVFERLPIGSVIVRSWSIRSPVVEDVVEVILGRPVVRERLLAIYEEGGSVLGIASNGLQVAPPPSPVLAFPFSISAKGVSAGRVTLSVPRTGPFRVVSGSSADGRKRARIHGVVVAAETGRALPGIVLRLTGWAVQTISDANGRFSFANVPAGTHELVAEMAGRKPASESLTLAQGGVYDLILRLATNVIELPGIEVAVEERSPWLELNGYYERRNLSGIQGHFIDRQYIDRRNPAVVTDLLHDIPSVKVLSGEPGQSAVIFNRQIGLSPMGGCEPDLYLDGVRYRSPNGPWKVRDWNLLPVAQLEAMEIYVGAATPIRFSHPCGVILLWTRRGAPGSSSDDSGQWASSQV